MTAPRYDTLLALLDAERAEERARLDDLLRTLAPEERAARGITLLDLACVDERYGVGGRILLELARDDRAELGARIDEGDLVELSPRRASEVPAARAVVVRRRRASLTVAFDQPPPPWAREGRLVVDLRPNDVTWSRARANVLAVRDDPRGQRRREVLDGARPPRFERLVPQEDPSLNAEQREAVARCLAAEELALVHGPPGTGKTTTLVAYLRAELSRGRRALVLAPSNAAVDHLTAKLAAAGLAPLRLGHPARVDASLHPHTLEGRLDVHPAVSSARELMDEAYERLGYARRQRARGRSAARFANAREAQSEARAMLAEARRVEREASRAIVGGARVVCATCAAASGDELRDERFDLAVCDEATQATEPIAYAAFLRAPKVVLAGDHQQLPPTVLSRAAQQGALGESLFERMVALHGDAARTMLREQHRMHADLMAYPSRAMYGGALRAHPAVAARTLAEVLRVGAAVDAPPLLFVDTSGRGWDEETDAAEESRANPGEAEAVTRAVGSLLAAGLDPEELAVITPYRAQAARIREGLSAAGLSDAVEVDTVDAFQGREKDAVVLSMVRANDRGELGFLKDLRRMNVAITRARRHLCVIGDAGTLARHPFYEGFLAHAEAVGGYRSAWAWGPLEDP